MEAVPDALPEPVVIQAAHVDQVPRSLPLGVASERGMQVKTILVGRSVSAAFPQIRTMIGVRPDAKPWHPSGLAVDIMIPNAGSAEGIALGDAILAYAMTNAGRFGVQDVIWRGTYYTPAGRQRLRLRPLRPRAHHHHRWRLPEWQRRVSGRLRPPAGLVARVRTQLSRSTRASPLLMALSVAIRASLLVVGGDHMPRRGSEVVRSIIWSTALT